MMIYKIIKSFAAHNCQVAFTKLSIPCPFYSVLNINGWAEMVSIDFRKFNFSLSSIHVLYLEYCCSHYYLWRRISTVNNGSIWKWCSFKNPFYVACWWQSGVEQSCQSFLPKKELTVRFNVFTEPLYYVLLSFVVSDHLAIQLLPWRRHYTHPTALLTHHIISKTWWKRQWSITRIWWGWCVSRLRPDTWEQNLNHMCF